jgi:predicted O-methyltransferase YrrM
MTAHAIRHAARTMVDRRRGRQPVSAAPFATHGPVLVGLARLREVRRVLELGSGLVSTPMFLDRAAFPVVDELVSYEDDPAWAARVAEHAGADERLRLHVVASVPDAVPDDLDGFDLVLVDDSLTYADRARTVRAVAARRPAGAVVAIHDYEHRQYAAAARGFDAVHRVRSFTPQVGVAWFGDAIAASQLEDLQRRIDARRGSIDVTDVAGWARAL